MTLLMVSLIEMRPQTSLVQLADDGFVCGGVAEKDAEGAVNGCHSV